MYLLVKSIAGNALLLVWTLGKGEDGHIAGAGACKLADLKAGVIFNAVLFIRSYSDIATLSFHLCIRVIKLSTLL